MRIFLIFFFQFLSTTGSELTRFALSIWIYKQTGSNTALSFMMLAGFLPKLIFSWQAGAIADRFSPKAICAIAELIEAAATISILVFITSPEIQFLPILCGAAFALGTANTFSYPAFQKILPTIVAESKLHKIISYQSAQDQLSLLLGPLLGGLFLKFGGMPSILMVDIISYVIGAWAIILFVPKMKVSTATPTELITSDREGIGFILKNKNLMTLIAIGSLTNFCFAFSLSFTTPYLLTLGLTEQWIGMLMSFTAAIQIGSSVLCGHLKKPKQLMQFELLSTFTMAVLCILPIGVFPNFKIVVVGHLLAVTFLPFLNIWNRLLWYESVPQEFFGKAFAIRRACSSALGIAGLSVSGPLIDLMSHSVGMIDSYRIAFVSSALLLAIAAAIGTILTSSTKVKTYAESRP